MIEKYGGGIVATVTPASLAPSSACSSPGRPPERLTPPSISNRGSRATRSSPARSSQRGSSEVDSWAPRLRSAKDACAGIDEAECWGTLRRSSARLRCRDSCSTGDNVDELDTLAVPSVVRCDDSEVLVTHAA